MTDKKHSKQDEEVKEPEVVRSEGITGTLSVIHSENTALAKYNIAGETGLRFDPAVHYELDEMLELGRALARRKKKDEFYEGDYLIEIKSRYPDAYGLACNLFGRDYGTMRNIVSVCANVPEFRKMEDGTMVQHRSLDPKVTFGLHVEVSPLDLEAQAELIKVAEAGVEDPITHQARPLTRDEFRAAIKRYKAAKAASEAGEEGETPEEAAAAVAPFVDFTFKFRGCGVDDPKEKPSAYETLLRTKIEESIKRHMDPKYRAKAEAKDRQNTFNELLKDVVKDDRAQFVTLFEQGKTIPELKQAISSYKQVQADAAALETALAEIPPSERKAFEDMRAEGKPISEIKEAVKTHAKKRTDRSSITEKLKDLEALYPCEPKDIDALLPKGTEEEKAKRAEEIKARRVEAAAKFLKMYDEDGKAAKDVKQAIADEVKIIKSRQTRENSVKKLVEGFTEEQQAPFLVMMHEGKTLDEIKIAVRNKRESLENEAKRTRVQNKDRIKELEGQINKKLRAINLLQETGSEQDKESAAVLQKQVDKMQDELDELRGEKEDKPKTDAPAGMLQKPKDGGPGSKKTSKKAAQGKGKKGGKK